MINNERQRHVSTHSRPKAAGPISRWGRLPSTRFNSQPPEGGWTLGGKILRGLFGVSTHSRPKAAGGAFRDSN